MENGFRSKQNSASIIRVEISFDLIMPSCCLMNKIASVQILQDLLAVVAIFMRIMIKRFAKPTYVNLNNIIPWEEN